MSTNQTPTVNDRACTIIRNTHTELLELLKESRYSLLRAVVTSTLMMLSRRFGQSLAAQAPRKKFPPLVPRPAEEGELQKPSAIAGSELAQEVELIYEGFTARDNDELRDSLTDIQIRGVAHKAGLSVTQTNPERITNEFIDQIKAAIIKKDEHQMLTDDPKQTLANEIVDTETRLQDVSARKAGVEDAIKDESLTAAKKKSLEKRLESLTQEEAGLYTRLEELTIAADTDADQN